MTEKDNPQFLSRWSRLKTQAREVAENPVAAETPAPQEADAEAIATRKAELQANREAAESVDLTTLDEKCDFSVFLKDGVPQVLRRQAMAALWRSSPVFANMDGLVDYGEDFAAPSLVQKTLQSAWQVGQGYLKDEPDTNPGNADALGADISAENGHSPTQSENADLGNKKEIASPAIDSPKPSANVEAITLAEEAGQIAEQAADPETRSVPHIPLRRRLMLDSGT